MKVVGSKGNQIMSFFDPKGFETKSKEYYLKIKEPIKNVTFDSVFQQFEGFPGDKNYPLKNFQGD